MAKLICVDPAHIAEIWPIVSDRVRQAIERGFSSFDSVQANVLDGLFLLWLVIDKEHIQAAVITGLFGDACEIIATAGVDAKSWVHLIIGIEKYARAEGKARVRIIGRRGWKRLLPDYKQTSIVLEKVI